MIPKNHKLQAYKVEYLPQKRQALVLATGWEGYHRILSITYPNACKSQFNAKDPEYSWGTYIDWTQDTCDELEHLLRMMTNVVCIEDQMRLSFALGYHFHSTYEGEGHTTVGEQVYQAKPYNNPFTASHREASDKLAHWFISFINRHPAYRRSDYLVPVPSHKSKDFDLPTYLVAQICKQSNIKNGTAFVSKNRTSESQKDLKNVEERRQNIKGAFTISPDAPFSGRVVTIIDDIYDTGTTIHEFTSVLQSAGAVVQGLTATRIKRGSYNGVL